MMSSNRPESLFPLFSSITSLDGIGPKLGAALEGAGLSRPKDMLFTLPYSGVDRRLRLCISECLAGHVATLKVCVDQHIAPTGRGRPYRVRVICADELLTLVFFRASGAYLQKQLPVGEIRIVSGKLEVFDDLYQMVHPDYIIKEPQLESLPSFEPIYTLHAGMSQKVMLKATQSAIKSTADLPEWIDQQLVTEKAWPSWQESLSQAHAPNDIDSLSHHAPARMRLAYDEIFAHQVTLALARTQQKKKTGRANKFNGELKKRMLAGLPFAPTNAQNKAIKEIEADLATPYRMNRLLQGDVGSGKTLVAFATLLGVVEAGGQGVMMAPTEILARQHYDGLKDLAQAVDVRLDVLTGRDRGRERKQKLEQLANGEIDILVGTHAVFQSDVSFSDLRLAIIDEQHRFGVAQRMELGNKGDTVDVLVMTATPIPRSLALAQYGDMDVCVLDEKPAGREAIQTALVSTSRLDEVVEKLKKAVEQGRQVYWVCPYVEESEVSDLTAAQDRFKHLRALFEYGYVGLVHGQMPPKEKDDAMARFIEGTCQILVATTVIEVGVNVPNASIMVIERAESFGLAQLHQLRGRVGRGAVASSCLLLFQAPLSESGRRRLEIMRETEDGFKIAQEDLIIRGAGDVIGTAQSGLPRFKIADLERQSALMQVAQNDARKLLLDDPKLETPRGLAVRTLLWLMEQDKAIRLITIG